LILDGKHSMTVTAVIEDLPSNTHFGLDVLAAGVSSYSPITSQDVTPMTVVGAKAWSFHTYGRLKRGESIAPLREGIRTLPDRHSDRAAGGTAPSEIWPLIVRPIRTLHLSAQDVASPDNVSLGRLYGAIGIGALIVLAAAINFVTLRTALAMRRSFEVGVRKACGGNRRALFVQFMSEVFVHVAVATLLGVALAAAALPALNAFLLRTIAWQTLVSPSFVGVTLALLVVVTALAGAYPAFVLASFRASIVTKARATGRLQNGVRQALVALQFAIVIAVLIATIVVHRQTAFGMRESLRQISDPILQLRTSCSDAIKDALARLPGVRGAACSAYPPQMGIGGVGPVQVNGGERLVLGEDAVDYGFFELFGNELAAGRYFSESFAADETPADAKWTTPESIMLNEAGVRKLGLPSAQAAIGQIVTLNHPSGAVGTFSGEHAAAIVGVVKDFQMGSVQNEILPSVFWVDPLLFHTVSLKLDGRTIPETLDAIDRVWAQMGDPGPPQRVFFEETVQQIYRDMHRDFELFSVFACIAILISALGLVGLAAHTASVRTKEIGVRKVLGSGRGGVMSLLLWQFGKPVLLANLIAWPAAYVAMSGWLAGFARRIALEPWMFVSAAVVTLAIAALTVAVHTWTIAGIRPAEALRHE
jgi:putative ABC transport system permease protein